MPSPPRAPGVDAGAGARPSPRVIPEARLPGGAASSSRQGASASVEVPAPRGATGALAALEAQLAAENAAAEEERARLAEACALLYERMEACCLRDASAQATREAAMKVVQEARASAQQEARLELVQLDAARETLQAEAAAWKQEMEARAKELDRRETELAQLASREAELAQRREGLLLLEEQLKAREVKVAAVEATYAERLAKANAAFEERQKKLAAEAADKAMAAQLALTRDFQEKSQKQEECFKAQRDELQARVDGLMREGQRMASHLEEATRARDDAEARATALAKDLSDLQLQVESAAKLVEEAQDNARHGRQMSHQRQLLLEDLVRRARDVADILGVEAPNFAPSGDEAAYTLFFEEFLGRLEEVASKLDARVTEGGRELLVFATTRIFSNLARLHPALDFADVMTPTRYTSDEAYAAAEEYAAKFDQAEVDEGDGADADEEDAEAGGGTS